MSGIMPNLMTVQYTVAKAGVIAMCEVLRGELAAENVGVSAFCPGPVRSQISKSGETRPKELPDTGYAETDRRRAANLNAALWMDPVEVGELVLDGIRKNHLYIFTHSEFGPGIKERCDAIMAAVPDKPFNKEFMEAVPFLLHNPIFTEKRSMKVALIGATGNIGSKILAELHARGHTVTAIARHPEKRHRRECRQSPCDANDEAQLANA